MGRAFNRTLQTALETLGFELGNIDGIVGSRTRAAIKSWRESLGVEALRHSGPLSVPERAKLLGWDDVVEGIDVSGWQNRVDWEKVREAGQRWAAIKLTQNNGPANADRAHQSAGAHAVMDLRIPYHFPDPNRKDGPKDAEKEAHAFVRQYEAFGPWNGPPAYDQEDGENRPGSLADDEYNLRHVVEWLDIVERLTGCGENQAIVYFASWSVDKFIARAVKSGTSAELVQRLVARPAWQADYHNPARHLNPIDPSIPWPASSVVIHQFAGRSDDPVARMPGVKGACDRNRMRRAYFDKLVGATA
jgi:GH25 family lysozyme M1 (1,4-beta-N-acetylmuramidase)